MMDIHSAQHLLWEFIFVLPDFYRKILNTYICMFFCTTWVKDTIAHWAPFWPRPHLVQCSYPLLLLVRSLILSPWWTDIQLSIYPWNSATFSTEPSTQKNKNGSNGNCVRGKKSQKTCSPSQARPRHQDHTRCAYSSISPFFVTVEAILIQSTISVSGAGCAPETHRMVFPPWSRVGDEKGFDPSIWSDRG